MRIAIAASIIYAFISSAFVREGADSCSIFVRIVNLRNNVGIVAVALYNSEKEFPEDSAAVFRSARTCPSGGEASVVFTGIPCGGTMRSPFCMTRTIMGGWTRACSEYRRKGTVSRMMPWVSWCLRHSIRRSSSAIEIRSGSRSG